MICSSPKIPHRTQSQEPFKKIYNNHNKIHKFVCFVFDAFDVFKTTKVSVKSTSFLQKFFFHRLKDKLLLRRIL